MRTHKTFKLLRLAVLLLLFVSAAQAQAPSPFIIRGEIHDGEGQKVACVNVCAMPEELVSGKFFPCVVSDAEGKFVIRLSEAGKYKLSTAKVESGYMPQHLPFYRLPSVSMPEVTLDSNTPTQEVSIILSPKSGALAGKSIDAATNLPVENVKITLCHFHNPSVCFQTSAKDAGGKFKVQTPPAPFTLKITAEGFEDCYGPRCTDKPESIININPGATVELSFYLKRREEAATRAINESEKQAGLNLPAPRQLSPADNAVFDFYPRKTKLEWEAVEGAVSYVLEIDYCRGGKRDNPQCVNPQPLALPINPPTSGITKTTYEFEFIGAQPGRWRVWAVDGEGREGFKSVWRKFIYLQ